MKALLRESTTAKTKEKKQIDEEFRDWTFEGYQRKVIFEAKKWIADEEQVEYLANQGLEPIDLEFAIQGKYNEYYRTNIHVTGTLSICINERRKDVQDRKKIRQMKHTLHSLQ